jgi:hypothetical protein
VATISTYDEENQASTPLITLIVGELYHKRVCENSTETTSSSISFLYKSLRPRRTWHLWSTCHSPPWPAISTMDYPEYKNVTGFDATSWSPHDGTVDSSDSPMSTSVGLDEARHIGLWLGAKPRDSENSSGRQRKLQNSPRRIFRSTSAFTSMTVHMETVYCRQNVTGFLMFPEPHDWCHG